MKDDMVVALGLSVLASNMKKKICDVLDGFFFILTKYDKKKTHKMLFLMLDSRFKSFRLVSSFIGKKQVVSMVEEYDR